MSDGNSRKRLKLDSKNQVLEEVVQETGVNMQLLLDKLNGEDWWKTSNMSKDILRSIVLSQARDLKKIHELEKKLEKNTMKRLLDLYDSTDADVEAFRNNFRVQKSTTCSASSHVSTSHGEAQQVEEENFNVDKIAYTSFQGKDFSLEGSTSAAGEWPKSYSNEAAVQQHVGNILDDAVRYINWLYRCAGGGRASQTKLVVRPETSLFSNKPDHMVVYDQTASDLPILCVETKKPHDLVFKSETVSGQILDYLMVGMLTHGKATFGVLTTFNHSKVVWLQDEACKKEAKMDSRMKEDKLSGLFKKLLERTETLNDTTPATTNPPSPPSNAARMKLSQTPPRLVHEGTLKRGSTREIIVSKDTYPASKLFTVLCNAIVASLCVGEKTLRIAENRGQLPANSTVLCLYKKPEGETKPKTKTNTKNHEWRVLKNGFILEAEPWVFNEATNEFLVVDYLGQGSTSRVWRAVVEVSNGIGRICVIKHWILVYNTSDNRMNSADEIKTQSGKSTSKELSNYKVIYKDLFFSKQQAYVGRAMLTNRWCMILPFFQRIQEEDQTEELLDEVAEILKTRFYQAGKSYQYPMTDQRWRHVGKLEGKVVLFDLADLVVKKASREDHQRYVTNHITSLRSRMKKASK